LFIACYVVDIVPETPAPRIMPPAIIPTGPPTTIRATPAPVVATLVVPAIATSLFFYFFNCYMSSIVVSGVSYGVFDFCVG
jgi:hypothetical protein